MVAMAQGTGDNNPDVNSNPLERWQNGLHFRIAIIVTTDFELRQIYERAPELPQIQTHKLCLISGIRSNRKAQVPARKHFSDEIAGAYSALVRDLISKIKSSALEAYGYEAHQESGPQPALIPARLWIDGHPRLNLDRSSVEFSDGTKFIEVRICRRILCTRERPAQIFEIQNWI